MIYFSISFVFTVLIGIFIPISVNHQKMITEIVLTILFIISIIMLHYVTIKLGLKDKIGLLIFMDLAVIGMLLTVIISLKERD